ncbi:hypothetical protein ACFYY8_31665 [Streptosporangium sp. NPDC001559]|uniref:hypothetical protein n=1 Tax=Streptosporangium sp. NPDC001559 TaxID=3366187 RepID=UPI0036EEDA55
MVYLYWRWPGTHVGEDGEPITERRASYNTTGEARNQARHDLNACLASDDYTAAPVRITDEDGDVLWTAPLPEGR